MGSGCDKTKRDYNLCKESAALWCTPTISRRFFDRFTGQSSKVSLSNFSLFCGFLENLARLSLVFIFKKLSAHDFLAFRVIWKQACRLDFSIFLRPCFYDQTSSGRWNFFALLWYIFFSWFLLLSIYKKTSESIRPFCRRNPTWVNNLKWQVKTLSHKLLWLLLISKILKIFPARVRRCSMSLWISAVCL